MMKLKNVHKTRPILAAISIIAVIVVGMTVGVLIVLVVMRVNIV